MEGLYKNKGKFGQVGASRDRRKESNKLRAQAKRQSIIAARRNMPLGELNGSMQVEKKASPLKPSKKVSAKPTDRLERLREWQKARDEAKAKANSQNKKPVFTIRNTNNTSIARNTTVFKPQYSTKKAILAASPKPAVKQPTARPPARPSVRAPAKVVEPPKKASRVAAPTRHSTRLASKQPVTKPVAPAKATTTKPTASSKQIAPSSARPITSARPTVSSAVTGKHAPGKVPARSIKPPNTKKGVVSAKSAATKAATGKKPAGDEKKATAVKRGKKSPGKKKPVSCDKTTSTGKRSKKASAEVDPVPTDVVVCALPVTPKKSYQPVHPSPLLKCHSATRQEAMLQQEPVLEYINDPAWITGAPVPDDASKPSFDSVFDTSFSPFQFTAGSSTGQDFQFKFQKDITDVLTAAEPVDMSQDSLVGNESTYQPNSSHTCTDDQRVDDVVQSSSDGVQSSDDVVQSSGDVIQSSDDAVQSSDDAVQISDDAVQSSDDAVHSSDDAVHSSDDAVHSSDDAVLTSDSATAAMLEDLIVFSDASDHEEVDSTPKLRRSARNVPRKSYSSMKRRKPAAAVDDSTTDTEVTPLRAKKSRTRQSSCVANMENMEGVVYTAGGDENQEGIVDAGSSKNMKDGSTEGVASGNTVDLPTESLAPMEEAAATTTTMKVQSAHRGSRKKSRRSSRRASSALGVARSLEADYDKENCSENGVQDSGKEDSSVDFRKLHSDVCEKLASLCEVWEGKESQLEVQANDDTPHLEDVLGQVRTTCCKARLVLGKKSKLTQFLGLVDTAESDNGEGKNRTTEQDLMGFWDMVYFEVVSLYKNFDELAEMEKNGWQALPPSPKKPKLQRRKKNVKPASKKSEAAEPSEKVIAARKKREVDRARLKALRMNSMAENKENDPAPDILTF